MSTRALFVSGTDTDAGKTYVTCELIRVLRDAGHTIQPFKPLCTGVTEADPADIGQLAAAANVSRESVAGLTFAAPLSPPSAARLEGTAVDVDRLDDRLRDLRETSPDVLVVEGAGGLLCPVDDTLTMRDLVQRWQLPLVVVAGIKLGAINHTLLTVAAAEEVGLIPHVILNEPQIVDADVWESTVAELTERIGDRIVGVVRQGRSLLQFSPPVPTIGGGEPLFTADELIALCQQIARRNGDGRSAP